MNSSQPTKSDEQDRRQIFQTALQILALTLLLGWCFFIIRPFLTPLLWGTILAISLYPLHKTLTDKFRGRHILSATLITILMMVLLIGPSVALIKATADEFSNISSAYQAGQLRIPTPNPKIQEWPVVGSVVYKYWLEASTNISHFIGQHLDTLNPLLMKLFELLSSIGKGIGLLMVSILVSGLLLVFVKPAEFTAKLFLNKLAGEQGESMIDTITVTIRNVAKGVLGVAFVESILAGFGMVLAGIPFAGLWTLIGLVLAIVQIGILPIMIGAVIYTWMEGDLTVAILFTLWVLFVSSVEYLLKPILMGKGAPVPMMVVFIGAVGGFLTSGFIGLFTGAIVLTLGYMFITGWLHGHSDTNQVKELL